MSGKIRYCKSCLRPFEPENDSQVFCCPEHEELWYTEVVDTVNHPCERCDSTHDVHKYIVLGDKQVYLCDKCYDKYTDSVLEHTDQFTGIDWFERAAKFILIGLNEMGFETDYDNFHDTPKRFARAYCEIFSGCKDTEAQVKNILSTSFPSQGSENMVVAKDIVCFSACPHHLLPVEYHVCVGYIPKKDGSVLGISKLARLVNVLAKRPALQETFTQEICDALDSVGSMGSIALVEGQHMCMRMRGAKATNTTITTTSVSGYFKDNPTTKQEFLNNVSDRMKFKG